MFKFSEKCRYYTDYSSFDCNPEQEELTEKQLDELLAYYKEDQVREMLQTVFRIGRETGENYVWDYVWSDDFANC
jgi:hypothetical protein